MRKFILISALLLASVSAHASQSRSLILASNDEPKAVETAKPAETKTEAKTEAKPDTTEAAKPTAAQPAKKVQAKRRESDEAKGAPDRSEVRGVLVMRNFLIVALMFWVALSYQNNHRDFGPKVEIAR